MATYAVGDLQGCFEPLERLLEAAKFDPAKDRVWFVGDLVNRGPDSLRCLRFVKSLGAAAITVLGNHDLHLICIAEGVERRRKRDTMEDVLAAPDRDEIIHWLRQQPLMHVEGNFALVHAGLMPEWSVPYARALAKEVETLLSGPDYRQLLARMYGDEPTAWSESLTGMDRLRVIINSMTRLRVLDRGGSMILKFKTDPGDATEGMTPWFDMPARQSADHTIVCGHWSALGVRIRPDLLSLDSGCVWGRSLTGARLEDRAVFEVSCAPPPPPAA
ncbi:MAG: symmetrical bis(5'-nucleosyl)-tetraphosphatase [Usitatibacter sp.]